MTKASKLRDLEQQLFRLQRKAEDKQTTPPYLRGMQWEMELEELRTEYKRIHERWKATKAQGALDV